MMPVNILVEGIVDEPVAKKLLKHVNLEYGITYGRSGKEHVLKQVPIYNKAARFAPWFALVDLDVKVQCPSEAIALWLPNPSSGMRFRIAVRAVEAWLMADKESMASFLSVSTIKIPHQVDAESDPKRTLINIARNSHNKSIRDDIAPREGSGANVGPLYVARLTEYTEKYWRPDEGGKHSRSLQRCINALSTLNTFAPHSP